jgi:nicotinate-nucleotide pyrophosphorylase (carboxylating)
LNREILSENRKERGRAAENEEMMLDSITMKLNADPLIRSALKEDITSDDVSTNSVMPEPKTGTVDLIAKGDGILCGAQVFQRTFQLLDPQTEVIWEKKDGDAVKKGERLAVVNGDIRVLLSGERTALNYLQRMSGIATYTHQMAEKLKGSGIKLLDTRKTTPNNRIFEKYAVTVGGGCNHRYNLSDGVMLKDNHIGAAGGIRQAVEAARTYAPFVRKIEVETETLDMVKEALDAGADIIMLDNMDHAQMQEAVELIDGRAEIEASGNVSMENLESFRDLGIDYVSSGALTHSAPILDLSLKHLHPVE